METIETAVVEYLRADRAVFLNTQCCIQLNEGANPDTSGPHWYCDTVAVDHRAKAIFLCEVSYAKSLAGLFDRLVDWNRHWEALTKALFRDTSLPSDWPLRPWLFVPEELVTKVVTKIRQLGADSQNQWSLPDPRITTLEMVQPWKYRSWNRIGETDKPDSIPPSMRT